jgi:hypothetical protein
METNITIVVILIVLVVLLYLLFGPKQHKRYYFVANEVVFQITHPASATTDDLAAALQEFLGSDGDFWPQRLVNSFRPSMSNVRLSPNYIPRVDTNWRKRLRSPKAGELRIVTFPVQEGTADTFSLIPVRLAGHFRFDLRSVAVSSILGGAYEELQNGPLTMRAGANINLQSISPNWFAKNLHHGGPVGGPGSWPLDALAPRPAGTSSPIGEHEFQLAGPIDSLQPYRQWPADAEVHVAVLDTAPSSALVTSAQRFLPPSISAAASNPLIQYLFAAGLDIHPYANASELTELDRYTLIPRHPQIPDHGTFAAGIVHTIAQNAKLHLYQVLNSYGVGTLTSVAQGLIDAINDHTKRGGSPLIINCSFMLDLVTQEGLSNLDEVLDLTDPVRSGLMTKSTLGVLTWITSLKNVVVVAAAGNYARPGVRPYASYPAAFKGVIGVGALSRDYPRATYPSGTYYVPASYSNFSYDPVHKLPCDGFMTFGGELDSPRRINGIPTSREGVLGVYVGQLFDRTRSASMTIDRWSTVPSSEGRANWAGTSFAAPIITGLLADPAHIRRSSTTLPGPYLTAEGENVIVIQQ